MDVFSADDEALVLDDEDWTAATAGVREKAKLTGLG
jgi:hypothetical protein